MPSLPEASEWALKLPIPVWHDLGIVFSWWVTNECTVFPKPWKFNPSYVKSISTNIQRKLNLVRDSRVGVLLLSRRRYWSAEGWEKQPPGQDLCWSPYSIPSWVTSGYQVVVFPYTLFRCIQEHEKCLIFTSVLIKLWSAIPNSSGTLLKC